MIGTFISCSVWAAVPEEPRNWTAIIMFGCVVAMSLLITWRAAKKTVSKEDFYTAGNSITAKQNGLAIAGDYMSASTLLGVSSMVFFKGYDGFIYVTGFFVCWPILTFLMAERLRNIGKYTFADIVSYRLDPQRTRILATCGSLIVVCCYLILQMVGAGQLIKLLFGLDYKIAVMLVGCLMLIYVIFGGMLATTWIQIVKAILLLFGGTLLAFLAFKAFDFSFDRMAIAAVDAHNLGEKVLQPGSMLSNPINTLSMSIGLIFGLAGLPHILMRFFTVPNAAEARRSVFYASGYIGYFFIIVCILGLASIAIVGTQPKYFVDGQIGGDLLGGSNMVAMHLASALGGNLMLGFLSAVAFATILAVVAGLTLAGASAISHDLFQKVIEKGKASEKHEMLVSKLSVVALGVVAIACGILFEKMNIAFLMGLTFGIAASSNFPILILSMYWKGLTTRGAIIGGFTGMLSAIVFVFLSPTVWVGVLGHQYAIFPYDNPALFSMPLAFLISFFFSITDQSERAKIDRNGFERQVVCSELGAQSKHFEKAPFH
ncbi:cation/acetate symporter ActP [Acinetobacter lactucae]|uniref:Cation/acetate symporter ActP n=1 Tax=Acinetobacter lactucae TaxID=1785128 RepID=A0A3R9QVP5_9GAMM|nr:cation/acetate symporter ActP [Acinetobacter lactucae]RSO58942.1 cation/acetate symporter ActP [Acinetobacter lactucae]